jgi:GntR family transcriptional repressor for pyruvate dehydrogenase complex
MKTGLKPIRVKRVSDQVFEQLRDLIFRGELKPGQKIMPERDLGEALCVSRTTIRNAINKLVTLGYLAHKQGQGTFVRSSTGLGSNPFALVIDDPEINIGHILDVRMGLECNAAAGAARNADSQDVEIIATHLAEMKTEVTQGRLGTEADVSFHMAIAYATKNPLQVRVMKNFYDVLFTGIHTSLGRLYEDPLNIDAIVSQHTAIAAAIERRQPDAAEAAMKHHISFVIAFFKSLAEA